MKSRSAGCAVPANRDPWGWTNHAGPSNPPCGYRGIIERQQLHFSNSVQVGGRRVSFSTWGPNLMTVKIDSFEPNIFPDVEDLDARDAGA